MSLRLPRIPQQVIRLGGPPLGASVAGARRLVDDWVHLATDRTVRLAVTGLNQSGKTVFITALIHQLLHGLHGSGLNFFDLAVSGRFRGSKVLPQPNLDVPAFRYDRHIEPLLGADPHWPTPTEGLSEIRLAIRFQSGGLLRRRLAPIGTFHLDIIDYPGEWLLDLPLLDMTYDAWSEQMLALAGKPPRRELAAAWLAHLQRLDCDALADEAVMREASALYTDFLHRCKSADGGLSFLQPGRFTVPGDLKDTPQLTFCPLPPAMAGARSVPGSLREAMARRFESYKERVVRVFYRDHFSRFDRQIVLIDLLRALNHGHACFADSRDALESILHSFQYGPSGLFSRLFRPRIDKLLFAATKVDHVAANQHHNLERLLNRMVVKPANEAVFQGVEVRTMALSSVTCTRTVVREHGGRRLSFVQGVPVGRDEPVLLFPGEIPESLPQPDDWDNNRFNFMAFKPPRRADPQAGLPHIRLDQALEFLLGDKLR